MKVNVRVVAVKMIIWATRNHGSRAEQVLFETHLPQTDFLDNLVLSKKNKEDIMNETRKIMKRDR